MTTLRAERYAWEVALPHGLVDDLPAWDTYLRTRGIQVHDEMTEAARVDGFELGPVDRIEVRRRKYLGVPDEPPLTVAVVRIEAPVTQR